MKLKENNWLLYAVLAALFWGIWGVVAKFVSSDINPYTNHFLFTIGMLVTVPFIIPKIIRTKPQLRGIVWGLIAGVLAITGNVAVYQSFVSGGFAAIVIPVTNLYPLITIAIAVFIFREKLNWINVVGILFAVPAVVMLSGQTMLFENPSAFLKGFNLNTWLVYALIALLFWGIFSAAQKVTTNYVSAEWSYLSFIVSSVIISILFMCLGIIQYDFPRDTFLLGSLAGMFNGLGVLASFAAYRAMGKASKVTTIAGALQPVFTIAFAVVFLSERFGIIEGIGISFAILSAIALSYEPILKNKP
ncbi:DMT family transporter [Pedobacter frigiditerrae]|uniref:DMT family transporter n=1 Tax=Pedobacter frigiditerrae TaxID=2530452 RepID=A0A4R0MPK1_9SPHI|nr:DMT family transporter [Pedobacter frigiditerrae]TCC88740.1 DMT family transporter [Pedobacter frigiditerrae]